MLIYLAGPIRSKDGISMNENVSMAKTLALELWKKGYAVICPHANTDLPIIVADKECEEDIWLNGDLAMLARCDALVVMPNWKGSKGTEGEIAFAEKHNIPIYYYPDIPEISITEINNPIQCQEFINTTMDMYRTHISKNSDYQAMNILGTGELGVVVRLWDKIARLLNLYGFRITITQSRLEPPKKPKHESIDDSFLDAAVYSVIGMLLRKGAWGK